MSNSYPYPWWRWSSISTRAGIHVLCLSKLITPDSRLKTQKLILITNRCIYYKKLQVSQLEINVLCYSMKFNKEGEIAKLGFSCMDFKGLEFGCQMWNRFCSGQLQEVIHNPGNLSNQFHAFLIFNNVWDWVEMMIEAEFDQSSWNYAGRTLCEPHMLIRWPPV